MKLNKEQQEAVNQISGSVLVVAGAGSGKTRVLTNRIIKLLQDGLASPSNILAITFTNKAANEMKARIQSMIGASSDQIWVGTFHSICVRILRMYAHLIGYTNSFVIYDTSDQKSLIKQIIKDLGAGCDVKEVQPEIQRAKNENIDPETYAEIYKFNRLASDIYREYQIRLKKNNAFDFDDLINYTIKLLGFKEVREYCQQKFKYIHVDEFQDTNKSQYELIRLISGRLDNVFAVGDYDQSIYKWRGAEIENILTFTQKFKDTKTILLEQNYRSTGNILKLANEVIKNNERIHEKNLWTNSGDGAKIGGYVADNERDESYFIADTISTKVRRENRKYSDFAILYRTNAQSRVIEESLLREQIPHKVIGGLKFFDRKEVKDFLAYLRLIVNPMDDVSFERVINEPKRGIGEKSLETLRLYARENDKSLFFSIPDTEKLGFTKKVIQGYNSFFDLITSLIEIHKSHTALEVFDFLLAHNGILTQLEQEKTVEAESRIENIYELRNYIAEIGQNRTLDEFLAEASLRSDQDQLDENADSVKLMTIHSSKGLEFPVVFLTGLEEGLFPSGRSIDDPELLEEERRLCYVGITRAEQKLYLSYAQSRNVYGKNENRNPSRFVDEMPMEIIDNLSGVNFGETSFLSYNNNYSSSFASPSSGSFGTHSNSKNQGFSFSSPISEKSVYTQKSKGSFTAGDRIKHSKFGIGMVVSVAPDGVTLTIAFDNTGIKKLNADFAPLERL